MCIFVPRAMIRARNKRFVNVSGGICMAPSVLEILSNEFAAAADRIGPSVVAVDARRRITSSGIQWHKGVIVTASHGIHRDEGLNVLVGPGKSIPATLAGRDPSTDLAILKLSNDHALPLPDLAETSNLKLANLVLAFGRSWRGHLVASAGIVGGLSGEWRTWRGGRVDQHIRLDLELYPGFSGGPLVNAQGKILGLNTGGTARGRAVTIPASTVNRVVDELLEKGHIARPYLGLAMQPVALPEGLRSKLRSGATTGLLVAHVEQAGPADNAGILLGDILVELRGQPLEGTENVQQVLASARVGDRVPLVLLRGGSPLVLTITLGDRPMR